MHRNEIIELLSSRLAEDVNSSIKTPQKKKDKAIRSITNHLTHVRLCNRQYVLDQVQNLLAPYEDEAVLAGNAGIRACWNLLEGDVDKELDVLTSLNDPKINPTAFCKALGDAILRKYKCLSKNKDAKANSKLTQTQHGSKGKIGGRAEEKATSQAT